MMKVADLQKILRDADPAAVLVSPRILERVIRQVCALPTLYWGLPHASNYVVDRRVLFQNAEQADLELGPDQVPPETVILLVRPAAEELSGPERKVLLLKYWRLLFHASVHFELGPNRKPGPLTDQEVRERIAQVGRTEFEEVRTVLTQDRHLPPGADDRTTYVEFAALYLELRYFANNLLEGVFPGIRDFGRVEQVLARDVNAPALFERTRLKDAPDPELRVDTRSDESDEEYWSLIRTAQRASLVGNTVRAAILRNRAARIAPAAQTLPTRQEAEKDVQDLTGRLALAVAIPSKPEEEEWARYLTLLLDKAEQGDWTAEARLLFDLQQVCIDSEKNIYTLDLVEWALSIGKKPIKRPLPSQRFVRVVKHMRAAHGRLSAVRLSDTDRAHLSKLLHDALRRSETALKARFRPILTTALQDAGLGPTAPLERVAFAKMVEELLDRISSYGFLTFSDLRDALSRNQLKLPDLTEPDDFIRGDPLVQVDRRLGSLLDGVYRPSEIYVRWLERLTALMFGTGLGRLVTRYLVIPFVGAFLLMLVLSELIALPQKMLPWYTDAPAVRTTLKALQGPFYEPPEASYDKAFDKFKTNLPELVRRNEGELQRHEERERQREGKPLGPRPSQEELVRKYEEAVDEFDYNTREEPGQLVEQDQVLRDRLPDVLRKQLPRPPSPPPDHFFPTWQYWHYGLLAGLGLFTLGLLQWPAFRRQCRRGSRAVGRGFRAVFWCWPRRLVPFAWVRRMYFSWGFQLAYWYLLKPLAICAILALLWPSRFAPGGDNWWWFLGAFVAGVVLFNSRIGHASGEAATDGLRQLAVLVRAGLLINLYRFIVQAFKFVLDMVEYLLFTVDEWLRFRGGEGRLSMVLRAVLSLVWFPISYVARFYTVVLVEPGINPLKFPISSVAAKIVYPYTFSNTELIQRLVGGLAPYIGSYPAWALVVGTFFWLPDAFGFLIWEMKENWKLFRANRGKTLQPVVVGGHGEAVRALLQPGFHSGTVPRLYARLREAERQAYQTRDWHKARYYREQLEEVEESVCRFIRRELVALLGESSAWRGQPLEVGQVRLTINRVRIELLHAGHPKKPVEIEMKLREGWLVANVGEPGWLGAVSPDQLQTFVVCLAALYKQAGIDLVVEQVRANLPACFVDFEIVPDGLLLRSADGGPAEVFDPWEWRGRQRAAQEALAAQGVDLRRLIFARTPLPWSEWVAAWKADQEGKGPPTLAWVGLDLIGKVPPPGPAAAPPLLDGPREAPANVNGAAVVTDVPAP